MKRIFHLLLLFLLLSGVSTKVLSQPTNKLQAIFLYNFSRLFAWPEGYQSGNFIIGVFTETPILSELQKIATTKKAGNQSISVKLFNSISDIGMCHILYIPAGEGRMIQEIVSHLKELKVNALVVSDYRNATNLGSVINFVMLDSGQKYELSKKNAREMGIIPGTEVVRLSIEVD